MNQSYQEVNYFNFDRITKDHLELFYRNIVNIETHYYYHLYRKWLTQDDFYSNHGYSYDFRLSISKHIIEQTLTVYCLFEGCESLDDILSMMEKYPIQLKRILVSIQRMSIFCSWLLTQENLKIDSDAISAIQRLIHYTGTLEFKTINTVCNIGLKDEHISYFRSIEVM